MLSPYQILFDGLYNGLSSHKHMSLAKVTMYNEEMHKLLPGDSVYKPMKLDLSDEAKAH